MAEEDQVGHRSCAWFWEFGNSLDRGFTFLAFSIIDRRFDRRFDYLNPVSNCPRVLIKAATAAILSAAYMCNVPFPFNPSPSSILRACKIPEPFHFPAFPAVYWHYCPALLLRPLLFVALYVAVYISEKMTE